MDRIVTIMLLAGTVCLLLVSATLAEDLITGVLETIINAVQRPNQLLIDKGTIRAICGLPV